MSSVELKFPYKSKGKRILLTFTNGGTTLVELPQIFKKNLSKFLKIYVEFFFCNSISEYKCILRSSLIFSASEVGILIKYS